MPKRVDQADGRNTATFIAMVGIIIVVLGLFLLVGMIVMPAITKVLLFFAALAGIGMLQYVLWGWKLDRDRVHDDEDT